MKVGSFDLALRPMGLHLDVVIMFFSVLKRLNNTIGTLRKVFNNNLIILL